MISDIAKSKVAQWEAELQEITRDETVRLIVSSRADISLELEEIAEIVMHVTGVPMDKLKEKMRKRNVVLARHLISWYARNLSCIRWQAISDYLGGRDHTSAIHGHKAIRDLLQTGHPQTVNAVQRIDQYLEQIKRRVKDQN